MAKICTTLGELVEAYYENPKQTVIFLPRAIKQTENGMEHNNNSAE
jgi:hypothetical protein